MIFLSTCSQDLTADMLVPFLKEAGVFRFDINRWREYRWSFSEKDFYIEHGGDVCTQNDLKCFYLRKAMFPEPLNIPSCGCLENWCREEISDIFRSVYQDYYRRGRVALMHPGRGGDWRKFSQMRLAAKYWKVPEWRICKGDLPKESREEWVVKSLTQVLIGKDKAFGVRRVEPQALSPDYPWFLQKRLEAQEDVSTLYVNGKMFSCALSRAHFEGEDSRIQRPEILAQWHPAELLPEEERKITDFMHEAGYSFGRFDFLRKDGELYFLELNPNGIWAWMDMDYKRGIFQCVADEIIACHDKA